MVTQREEANGRGLPSLDRARAERRRASLLGTPAVKRLAPQVWLWGAVLLAAFVVLYWRHAEGELESAKGAVMAKQRAIAKSLGPRILPFRDKVERWAGELARPWNGSHVASLVSLDKLTKSPGVYLRLRLEEAKEPKQIREAAQRSLLDGFTSCMFVGRPAADPTEGPKCTFATDCDPGLLCNEWNVCRPPPRPYNMRLAYRALRVLSSQWTDELHQADSDLAVKAYDRALDSITRTDVPVAIEVLQRSKYATIVLDELPAQGLPEPLPGVEESAQERIQRVPHMVRVGIWELASGRNVIKWRTEANARFIPVGKRRDTGAESRAAQQRQANNCAVALEIREALQPKRADAASPAKSGEDAESKEK